MAAMAISDVVVTDRHRSDLGDVAALASSITDVGLLHPIVVTEENRLVAGQRRLEAYRSLGWQEIPVTVVTNLTTAAALLRAEQDENECRKEMTVIEKMSLTDELLELERPKAEERKTSTQAKPGNDGRNPTGPDPQIRTGEVDEEKRKASSIAAEAAGWSRGSYERTKRVVKAAEDETLPDEVREVAAEQVARLSDGTSTPRTADTALKEAKAKASVDSRPPSPPKYGGNRRKHLAQIEAVITGLSGYALVFDDVDVLDASVTAEEAARLRGDLSTQIRALNRINRLLKERT